MMRYHETCKLLRHIHTAEG